MADERRVLIIAQDVIHSTSNARVKVPKHVSLAMTVHHLTTSKLLIMLLNQMGHCSSYDEIQSVDTSIAIEVAAKNEEYGTVIPSNISPMSCIQLPADNNDFNEETLDGKNTTHATTMVVCQRKPFSPEPPPNLLLTIHNEDPFKHKGTFMKFKSSLHTGEGQQLHCLLELIRMNVSKKQVKYTLWRRIWTLFGTFCLSIDLK